MSRALRRHPISAKPPVRGPSVKAALARPQPKTQAPKEAKARRFRFGAPAPVSDVIAELRKVTWPSREETIYLTVVVLVVSLVIGAFLGGVDIFFNWLIDNTLFRLR